MQIEVRRAEDYDTVPLGVAHRLPPALLESKRRDGLVTLAWVRGQPVGWIVHTLLWARIPFVELLWVEDDYRRQGVAAALLVQLEERLRGEGATLLFSSAQDDNPGALAWHFEQGFVEAGVIDGVNAKDVGEVFFHKSLVGEEY